MKRQKVKIKNYRAKRKAALFWVWNSPFCFCGRASFVSTLHKLNDGMRSKHSFSNVQISYCRCLYQNPVFMRVSAFWLCMIGKFIEQEEYDFLRENITPPWQNSIRPLSQQAFDYKRIKSQAYDITTNHICLGRGNDVSGYGARGCIQWHTVSS